MAALWLAVLLLNADDGLSSGRVDPSTLTGKVMAGYQGWFTAAGDGSDLGWQHYQKRGEFRPGRCSIDLWPDVSELDPDELFATPFRHADGKAAHVFSSHHRKTVVRHFHWMRQYGIDGVFVQRFVVETFDPVHRRHVDAVLDHCREGANQHGRCYAVMYDLSGLRAGGIERTIDDWKQLVEQKRLGRDEKDRAYLHHRGRPVVAVWGLGFNDGREYTRAECDRLVDFLKSDRKYGGNTVVLGVPTGWRTLDRDAIADPAWHGTYRKGHVISPWTVGRYDSPQAAERHAKRDWQADIAWCREQGQDYLPVVFPGFSWHNLRGGARLDQIPRLGGEFLWRQFTAAKKSGATMIYVAMFDELDEGTAVFKCTSDPPIGDSPFLTFGDLKSDHYLWLTGAGGKLLRGELDATDRAPSREP